MKKLYDVTFVRFGCAMVAAESKDEALRVADKLQTNEISWNDDWKPDDAYETGENPNLGFVEEE